MKKTGGVFSNGVIWFGAAISLAEIEAGLSIGGDWSALVAGHVFGGSLLFAAGLLGAIARKNAMETTASAFGVGGMRMFAALNVVQLAGWTAVMLDQGASAVSALTGMNPVPACIALAVLTAVWIFVAFGDRLHLATVTMAALAALAVALTLKTPGAGTADGPVTPGFWPAFEISAAMPISWLPLISDYTSKSGRPKLSAAVSAAVYTLASIWMYALGMRMAESGAASIADAIVKSGVGAIGLTVAVFSTVTTTFLDAYSSGESAKSVFAKAPVRAVGVAVCVIGCLTATCGLTDDYIGFLCLISSVFAPMVTVLLTDAYLVKRGCAAWNLCAWLVGVAAYHLAAAAPIGPTLTAVTASALASSAQLLFPVRRA